MMALPKGTENLGQKAKEIAAKASQPIARKVDDVRQTVASQEGLKNIAFQAGGNDPVVGITTGIALGISALGVGLGVKGLKSAFKGVGRLVGNVQKDNEVPNEDIEDDAMVAQEQADTMKDFQSETENQLGDLLDIAKDQLFLSENVLTAAARQRLDDARARTEQIESDKEALRLQKEQLKSQQDGGSDGVDGLDGGSDGLLRKLFAANLGSKIIGKLSAGLIGGIAGIIPSILKNLPKLSARALPKLLSKTFSKISFVAVVLGMLNGLKDGFIGAMEGEGVKGKIGGFVAGLIGGLAEFFSFGLFDSDKAQTKMKDLANSFFKFFASFENLAETLFENKFLPLVGKIFSDIGETAKLLGLGVLEEVDKFTKESGAKLSGLVGKISGKIVEFWDSLIETTRLAIIGMLDKIPGVGDALAKQFMTQEERDKFERQKALKEGGEDIQELRDERASVAARESGGFLQISREKKAEKIAEIDAEIKQKLDDLKNLRAPVLQPSDRQTNAVAEIKTSSAEIASQNKAPVIISAPAISNSVQNQNVTNSMVLPMSVQNNESAINRAFESNF